MTHCTLRKQKKYYFDVQYFSTAVQIIDVFELNEIIFYLGCWKDDYWVDRNNDFLY